MSSPQEVITTSYSVEEFFTRLRRAHDEINPVVDEVVSDGQDPYFVGLVLLQASYRVLKEHGYYDTPEEVGELARAICQQVYNPSPMAANSLTQLPSRRS